MSKWDTRTRTRSFTVADLIDRYRAEVLPRQPRVERNQRAHLEWWKREIGGVLLEDVGPSLLVDCRNKLGRSTYLPGHPPRPGDVSIATWRTLSRMFTIAVREWEWLDDSPVRRLAKLREPHGRSRFLSADERERLLRACRQSPNRDLYLAVVLALSTGARRMEVMGLRWRDIDLKRGLIMLRATKNGSSRSVPLQGYALELVREKHRRHACHAGRLFPGRRNPNQPADLRIAWANALRTAAVKDFRWHDLRHSAASYLAMGARPGGNLRSAGAQDPANGQAVRAFSGLPHDPRGRAHEPGNLWDMNGWCPTCCMQATAKSGYRTKISSARY